VNLQELQSVIEKTIRELAVRGEFHDRDLDRLLDALPDAIASAVTAQADLAYDYLLHRTASMLRDGRGIRRGFEKRLYKRWRRGIDLLDAYLMIAAEAGEAFNRTYREEAARTDDHLFEALIRLQARAVQVGREVLSLLCAGFADGGHARWRTAHEIAVVANFLKSRGRETARRYLEHQVVESYKAMMQYEEYADRLQYEHYSAEEYSHAKSLKESLCARYGEEFQGQYGWAAAALCKRNPRFFDIEQASGMDHLRPYYRMASHNVHAGAKGIMFRLGVSDGLDLLLAGPSNQGLADPADGVARSVMQATVPMLVTRPDIDNLATAKIMMRYVTEIGEAFLEAHRAMGERD